MQSKDDSRRLKESSFDGQQFKKIEIVTFKAVGRTTALLLKYPPEMTIVM